MYYEINVAYNKQHYFATAPRSLTNEEKANVVFKHLKQLFPEADGFTVTMYRYETVGKEIK